MKKTMTVEEQARTALQVALKAYIDAEEDLTAYAPMLDAMVFGCAEHGIAGIGSLLKGSEDASDETVDALVAENAEMETRIVELEAAVAKAEAAAKVLKAKAALAPKAVAPSKSKSKTKSGGERAANAYSSFMALLKGMSAVPEIAEAEVTVDPQFSATALKSKGRYDEHRDQILHDGQPLHGQTVTLQQAYDSITAASEIDPLFKNAAVRTAILWAMLSAEQRKEIVGVGRANGLCR